MGSIPVGTAKKVYTPFAVYIVATIYSENTNLIASRTFSTTTKRLHLSTKNADLNDRDQRFDCMLFKRNSLKWL